jgi:hypothetical protein
MIDFDAFDMISAVAQLSDKVILASNTDRRTCGHCSHWMKKYECPRENKRLHGPSCEDAGCEVFRLEQWVADLKAERISDAVQFAKSNSLPIPEFLAKGAA